MSSDREHFPAELERAVMLEAGYRCAVPACRTALAVEIHHIDDYAKVRTHEFANLIALCANCHRGLVGSGPRRLDPKALRAIKRNLGVINGRYNDTERRVLEHFVSHPDASHVVLPETPVLFSHLIKDGLLEGISDGNLDGVWWATVANDDRPLFMTRAYRLTEEGKDLVARLRDNTDAG